MQNIIRLILEYSQKNKFQAAIGNFMSNLVLNEIKIEQLKANFKLLDSNKDGTLDRQEVRMALESIMDQTEIEAFLKEMYEADTNNDGLIDYQEFTLHAETNMGGQTKTACLRLFKKMD